MKTHPLPLRMTVLMASMIVVLACNLMRPPSRSETPIPNAPTSEPATMAVDATATQPQAEEPTLVPVVPTATTGPQCTVLQQLYLRSGPGTAYDPPLTGLAANTVLIPIGYDAAGVPGGTWVQVQEPDNQQKGWVSGGSAYISCNVDITGLPNVTADPPPQPPRPKAVGSNGEGPCTEGPQTGGDNAQYTCKVQFSGGMVMGIQYFRDGKLIGKGSGIKNVVFTVDKNGSSFYTYTAPRETYCLFGGNGPCGAWVFEDYEYKWGSGGPVVEPGDYTVNIDPTPDQTSAGQNLPELHWQMDFHVTLP